MHVFIQTDIQTQTLTSSPHPTSYLATCLPNLPTYIYIYLYTHIYRHACIHANIHAYMHMHAHVLVYCMLLHVKKSIGPLAFLGLNSQMGWSHEEFTASSCAVGFPAISLRQIKGPPFHSSSLRTEKTSAGMLLRIARAKFT